MHLDWLKKKIKALGKSANDNIQFLLNQYDNLNKIINEYNNEIEKLSHTKRYQKKKEALCCFRGLSTLSAMTLVTEIGDAKRFSHPKKLTSYAGLGI